MTSPVEQRHDWKAAHDGLYDRLTHLQADRDALWLENQQLRKDLATIEAVARWGERSENQCESERDALLSELQRVYGVIQAHENGEYMDGADCLIRIGEVIRKAEGRQP